VEAAIVGIGGGGAFEQDAGFAVALGVERGEGGGGEIDCLEVHKKISAALPQLTEVRGEAAEGFGLRWQPRT
jgi:hypothetical protein